MKLLLKCKNKTNLCIFCLFIMEFLFLLRGSYFNKKLRKDKSQFWWLCHKIGRWQFLTGFRQFRQHLSCNFEKNFSFKSHCRENVNRHRKDIKVCFGLHAGRFTVECTKNGNTLFSYFDIFICVSSNFTLDSRIAGYLQCHIGL